ncbi:homoisocitrate dehydrogenase [Massospora cicadina]|nr:homoisocitrate dehydrogenase [Massospora cicadina]
MKPSRLSNNVTGDFLVLSVALRKKLDLYANVRPVKSASKVKDYEKRINCVIVRENTECLYIKDEELAIDERGQKFAIARRKISRFASRRCGDMAFRLALDRQHLHKDKKASSDDCP